MTGSNRTLVIVVILLALVVGSVFLLHWPAPRVELAPEPLFYIGGFGVTNTILTAYVTTALLALLFWLGTRKVSVIPGRLQAGAEIAVETFLGLCTNAAGEQNGRRFFSLVTTIFLFVLVANWLGLLPGFGTVGIMRPEPAHTAVVATGSGETAQASAEAGSGATVLVPIFRGATTDLNTTLALALIAFCATEYFGVKALGAGTYLSKFFNFKGGPMGVFVGLIELISEFSRIISLSFRLFGNIFAGEVLLAVVAFLVPIGATLPFLGLELFVGMVQALIFAMLTLVFMTIATIGHSEHQEGSTEHGH